jgi:hypothetical protein
LTFDDLKDSKMRFKQSSGNVPKISPLEISWKQRACNTYCLLRRRYGDWRVELSVYRNFHIQSVLGVAKNQTVSTSLRSRSLRTSKPSRILARVLAKQDAIAIAHMIQKELDGAPSSPPSSSDGTTSSEADATSAAASPFSMSSRHRDRFA